MVVDRRVGNSILGAAFKLHRACENRGGVPRPERPVQLPLVQWGGRSAQIQAARADQARIESTAQQSREQLTQEAHFGALQLAQARRQLLISAKADSVAALRFEVAKNRYIIGRIGMDNLYQAQTEKDQVLNAYLRRCEATGRRTTGCDARRSTISRRARRSLAAVS